MIELTLCAFLSILQSALIMQRTEVHFALLEATSSLQAFEIAAGDLAGKAVISGNYHFPHNTVKVHFSCDLLSILCAALPSHTLHCSLHIPDNPHSHLKYKNYVH